MSQSEDIKIPHMALMDPGSLIAMLQQDLYQANLEVAEFNRRWHQQSQLADQLEAELVYALDTLRSMQINIIDGNFNDAIRNLIDFIDESNRRGVNTGLVRDLHLIRKKEQDSEQ